MGWLLGVVDRFERLKAAAGKLHGSRTDRSTDDPQRWSKVKRVEVQPEAGH